MNELNPSSFFNAVSEKFRFIPGIETAPGANRVRLTGDGAPPIVFAEEPDRFDWDQTHRDLARRQPIARELGQLTLDNNVPGRHGSHPRAAAYAGWRQLRADTSQWLGKHLDEVEMLDRPPSHFASAEEYRARMHKIAAGGIATVIAFQAVVPRVLYNREFSDPATDIRRWIHGSLGFVMEWMGLHEAVDPRLAFALASPKPSGGIERVFEDLQFDPKRFVAYDDMERVGLDPRQVPNLRDETHMRTPQSRQPKGVAVFGCPARKLIPHIYRTIEERAAERGLFAATYYQERVQYGYDDALIWAGASRAGRISHSAVEV